MNEPVSPLPSSTRVILALRKLNSSFSTANKIVGSMLGIKDSDLAVLDTLNQEGPQTPTVLARRTSTHLATMTGILDRLERDGWIERRPDAADRRSVSVHNTGVNRLIELYARPNQRLASLLEGWTDDQAEMLARFLTDASEIVTTLASELIQDQGSGVEQNQRAEGGQR